MRNFIIKLMIIIILVIDPSHFTASSTLDYTMTKEEMKKLSLTMKKYRLSNHIKNEYDLFYLNLENTRRRNIKFINELTCHALDSKTLPSITIAQAIIETGYGKHNKLKRNIFGIKGRGIKSKTKEFVNGKYVRVRAEFQKFDSYQQAFDRHSEILNRYGITGRDYKYWANRIQDCGYATDPRYAEKLIIIIERHQLYRLDKIQEYNKYINFINQKKYSNDTGIP